MASEKLNSAIAAIKLGDKATGSRLLNELLKDEPSNETAWIWLTACVDDVETKIDCLKKALSINPNNQIVIKALSKLEQPPQPTLDEIVPNQVVKNPPSSKEPISNQDKTKIIASDVKPALDTPILQSPAEVASKIPSNKRILFYVILVIVLIFVCYRITALLGSGSSTSTSSYLSIGDNGVLYNGSDKVPVAATKDVLDQVIHISTANDTLGYAQLVGAGLVIQVDSGTKIIILDSTAMYKQVRIKEGEYVGESGWIPSEWAKK